MIYGWAVVHNTGRMILNCSQAQFKMPVFIHLWIQMYFFWGGVVISFLQESVGDVLFHGEDAG